MRRSLLLQPDATLRTALKDGELEAALEDKLGVLWLDLDANEPGAPQLLRAVFGFHPLAVEDSFDDRANAPKVDDYGAYLFILAQSVSTDTRGLVQLKDVGMFLGPNFVVTVREAAAPAVDELFARAVENPHLISRGADFLAHTVLDALVDELLPAVEAMDARLDELEQRILERPDRGLLSEILLLRRTTLRLRRSILPERDMVNRLSRGEFPLIRDEALIFYRDVYDHIVRVEEMLDGLRDVADSALSSYLSAVNNRMNEIMKAMSVVAVIFLPLTLIASIYGTNLDYSHFGIDFEYGFYLMLGVMAAIAAGLIVFFRKRGWF